MAARIACYVMCGGLGMRLWPLSRQDKPKQFHDLVGGGTMLAATLRLATSRPNARPVVKAIGLQRHGERIGADLVDVGITDSPPILEPFGRNTAATVALATHDALAEGEDMLVLVLPADHSISPDTEFWNSVERGIRAAMDGRLVVFGIRPDRAETGFGYIEAREGSEGAVRDVLRFVEKPNIETAKDFVACDRFFWNSGIFLFRAGSMRNSFRRVRPGTWEAAGRALSRAKRNATGIYVAAPDFGEIEPVSFDHAVIEHLDDIAMVAANFGWSDLGTWRALHETATGDADGNAIFGDVVSIGCKGSYLRSSDRLVAAVGLEGIAVVSTPDAVFVAPLEASQQVKAIVEELEKSGRLETRLASPPDRAPATESWRSRVRHWLFEEALPRWGKGRRG